MRDKVERLLNLVSALKPEDRDRFLVGLNKSAIDFDSLITSERTRSQITCPKCGSKHISRSGFSNSKQRYICVDCKIRFMESTNSILFAKKIDNGQLKSIFDCLRDDKTIRQTAEIADVNPTTAFHWRHKILDALAKDDTELAGIVEADEAFFRISYKGNYSKSTFKLPRPAKKRGEGADKRGLSDEQICVPCAIDRSNHAISKISCKGKPNTNAITAVFKHHIESESIFITDKANCYTRYAHHYNLKIVKIKAKHKIANRIYHIQTVNSYHSGLKKFIRRFNGVSTKYLNNYLTWFTWQWINKSTLVSKTSDLIHEVIGIQGNTLRENLRHRAEVPVLVA